jgi:hypothetical protein
MESDRRVSFDPDTDEYFELSKARVGKLTEMEASNIADHRHEQSVLLDEDQIIDEENDAGDPIAAAEALAELYDVNIGEIARLKEMLLKGSPDTVKEISDHPEGGRESINENDAQHSVTEPSADGTKAATTINGERSQRTEMNGNELGGAVVRVVPTDPGPSTGDFFKKSNVKQSVSTTDRLIQKKYEYEQRRVLMRRAQAEAEEAEMQIKPQINKHSERLLSGQARKSIAERSQEQVVLKKERAEKLKAELAAKESNGISHRPQINGRSRKLTRDVVHMQQWEQEKVARREVLQHMQAMEQDLECSFVPTLNKRTEKLTAARSKPRSQSLGPGNRRSGVNFVKIEDRLLQQAEMYREKREVAKERKDHAARQQAIPQVAPHSANLPRSGDIASRLYGIAEAKRNKQLKIERRTRVLVEHNIDPETGNELFKPKINASSKAMVRRRRAPNERVEDSLTAHGESYQKRQQDRQVREDREARERTAVKINRQSEKIVGALEQRTQESAMDRLAKPTGHRVKRSTIDILPQYSIKLNKDAKSTESELVTYNDTFDAIDFTAQSVPEVDMLDCGVEHSYAGDAKTVRPSVKVKSGSQRGPSIAERSAIWEQKRASKERALALEREKAITAECSFAPKVSAQSSRAASRANTGKGSMWERNTEWSKRRAEKLEAERKVKELEELAECTFEPNAELFAKDNHSADTDGDLDVVRSTSEKSKGGHTPAYGYEDNNGNGREESTDNAVPSEADIREVVKGGSMNSKKKGSGLSTMRPRYMIQRASLMDLESGEKVIDTTGEVVVKMPTGPAQEPHTLPPGWRRVVSVQGHVYYYDAVSGVTQWEAPTVMIPTAPEVVPPQPPPPWADSMNQHRLQVRLDDYVDPPVSSVTSERPNVLQSQTWLKQARIAAAAAAASAPGPRRT